LPTSARRVADALTAAGITTTIVVLEHAVPTSAAAAAAVGCDVAQIAKSLVFRLRDTGQPLLVITSGANRVDEARVGALVGEPIRRCHRGSRGRIRRMIRRPATLLLACVLLLTSTAALGRTAVVPPSAFEMRSIVETLTAPEMDGRRAGTAGGDRATNRIADWLQAAGLRPGGDAGSFLQSFTLAPGRRLGPTSTLEIGGRALKTDVDWVPHGGSRPGEVSG